MAMPYELFDWQVRYLDIYSVSMLLPHGDIHGKIICVQLFMKNFTSLVDIIGNSVNVNSAKVCIIW